MINFLNKLVDSVTFQPFLVIFIVAIVTALIFTVHSIKDVSEITRNMHFVIGFGVIFLIFTLPLLIYGLGAMDYSSRAILSNVLQIIAVISGLVFGVVTIQYITFLVVAKIKVDIFKIDWFKTILKEHHAKMIKFGVVSGGTALLAFITDLLI